MPWYVREADLARQPPVVESQFEFNIKQIGRENARNCGHS
jgi:hypothetical protein